MDLGRPLAVITPTVDADVLTVLARAHAAFTGRQVHRVAGRHSERGVRNALQRLCLQGIVTRERFGSSDLYSLNRSHLAAPHIQALAQLRDEMLHRIGVEADAWRVPADYVALFGSAARGDMTPSSDIDLFVVRPENVDPDGRPWRSQLDRLAEHVTGWTGNDARLFELGAIEVRAGLEAADQTLTDIREHGVTLWGTGTYLRLLGRGG